METFNRQRLKQTKAYAIDANKPILYVKIDQRSECHNGYPLQDMR